MAHGKPLPIGKQLIFTLSTQFLNKGNINKNNQNQLFQSCSHNEKKLQCTI